MDLDESELLIGDAGFKGVDSSKESYDEHRDHLKYGPITSGLFLLQSAIGIALFTLHNTMLKVGIA